MCFVVNYILMLYGSVCSYVCVRVCVCCLYKLVWFVCDLMGAVVRLAFLVCVFFVVCCVV